MSRVIMRTVQQHLDAIFHVGFKIPFTWLNEIIETRPDIGNVQKYLQKTYNVTSGRVGDSSGVNITNTVKGERVISSGCPLITVHSLWPADEQFRLLVGYLTIQQ